MKGLVMKKIIDEFKTFINRGNILDLAVAVVVGGAFTKIINSFVKDVLSPMISIVLGDEGFVNFKYVLTEADEAEGIVENAIYYGRFIQNSLDFLVVAVVIFIMIKIINKVKQEVVEMYDDIEEMVEDIVDDITKEKLPEIK